VNSWPCDAINISSMIRRRCRR